MGAFSEGKLLNMLRSAALLCPVAYLDQIPSPMPRIIAEVFLPEVCTLRALLIKISVQINMDLNYTFLAYFVEPKLYLLEVREFIPNG